MHFAEGDGVDPHHAKWVRDVPTNFICSPPFSCTDFAFARNAELGADYSSTLLSDDVMRTMVANDPV